MDKIKINEIVVVEGKYDKIRLESLIDAYIITTGGFALFKDRQKQAMLRKLAAERGILILTDSDGAGFVIRNFLRGIIPAEQIKHAYIPQLSGKEHRKDKASKEGLLGVEGMDNGSLKAALANAGVSFCISEERENNSHSHPITRNDLMNDGLIGSENSKARREALLMELKLPAYLSVNALLETLNILFDREEYAEAVKRVNPEH